MTTMLPFGVLLNSAIQTIKKLASSSKISDNAFKKKFIEVSSLTDEMLAMRMLDPNIETEIYRKKHLEDYHYLNCVDELIREIINILEAIGIIYQASYPLYVSTNNPNFLNFVAFDDEVTPDNLIKIDPFGKIFFWLVWESKWELEYTYNHIEKTDTYFSDLEFFNRHLLRKLKAINYACYGEDGDPLINYLITETLRRCSVFMNNYADVDIHNDFDRVTNEKLLKKIMNLTPLQFEYLCLSVVEHSLKADTPDAEYEVNHVGKTNDGGLDGYIKQTFANGEVHHYYIQAKQYADNKVANHHLRNFIGAYPPNKDYHHGIFVTTSDYSQPALKYANELESHSLILINQIELLSQMLEHEVGVEKIHTEIMVMSKNFFRQLRKFK